MTRKRDRVKNGAKSPRALKYPFTASFSHPVVYRSGR